MNLRLVLGMAEKQPKESARSLPPAEPFFIQSDEPAKGKAWDGFLGFLEVLAFLAGYVLLMMGAVTALLIVFGPGLYLYEHGIALGGVQLGAFGGAVAGRIGPMGGSRLGLDQRFRLIATIITGLALWPIADALHKPLIGAIGGLLIGYTVSFNWFDVRSEVSGQSTTQD